MSRRESSSSSTRRRPSSHRSSSGHSKRPRSDPNHNHHEKDSLEHCPSPKIVKGQVEFPLEPVNEHLICPLCDGYLREAFTISECLHSFCKSCLFCTYNRGITKCPVCNVNLGPDPYTVTIYDRTLQELVDKILPELKKEDAKEEREYYVRNGIPPKNEFVEEIAKEKRQANLEANQSNSATPATLPSVPKRNKTSESLIIPPDELSLDLRPHKESKDFKQLPALKNPSIRTSGRLKIVQLKKFLAIQLDLPSHSKLEVRCNDDVAGDELSLTFVERTRWLNPDEDMVLTYQSRDGF